MVQVIIKAPLLGALGPSVRGVCGELQSLTLWLAGNHINSQTRRVLGTVMGDTSPNHNSNSVFPDIEALHSLEKNFGPSGQRKTYIATILHPSTSKTLKIHPISSARSLPCNFELTRAYPELYTRRFQTLSLQTRNSEPLEPKKP